jgi:hypothetical protein
MLTLQPPANSVALPTAGTPVRFNIRLKVDFGQQLFVVGSCASLGAWNMDNAVKLNWQEGHIWEAAVELPAG